MIGSTIVGPPPGCCQRHRQTDRQTDRQTETDRQRQTETDRDRQRQTETDRDRQRQTETDRDRQRQTETDRDRQRQTDRQTERETFAAVPFLGCPFCLMEFGVSQALLWLFPAAELGHLDSQCWVHCADVLAWEEQSAKIHQAVIDSMTSSSTTNALDGWRNDQVQLTMHGVTSSRGTCAASRCAQNVTRQRAQLCVRIATGSVLTDRHHLIPWNIRPARGAGWQGKR